MILDKFKLTDKVAIVTGATRGIGKAIAIGLAEAGADIVCVGRSDDSEVKNAVEALGRRYLNLKLDVGNPDTPDIIVEKTVDKFGKIDILVNAAGTSGRLDAIECTQEEWKNILDVNVTGLFFISQKAARQFIKQGTKGKIINIASMTSYIGSTKVITYAASKAAVRNVTMQMCNEWAKYNIYANAIAPGWIVTKMTERMRGDASRMPEINARIPMGRWGVPEDMAGAAVFLASDASDYVNGFTLAVDGGFLGR